MAILLGASGLAFAEPGPMRVTFINPGKSNQNDPTGGFWVAVSSFMQAVADDLRIDLEILYAERDHLRMQDLARAVAARQHPPQYLVVVNEKLAAEDMVHTAERAGINTFVVLNRFEGEQARDMGQPRTKHPHWLGSLIPDNQFAGYELARRTIDRALAAGRLAADGQVHVVAIAGDHATQASVERLQGLHQAVAAYTNVTLKQIFFGAWRQDKAHQLATEFLSRYPETGVIWAANDPMALGALEAAQTLGKVPGQDLFIGGVNGDPPGVAQIQAGTMETSLIGHFMTAGWALVLLHDYHQGRDFADEGVQLQARIFGALHTQNIGLFLERFGDRDWHKIDFTRFSKVCNPALRTYDFSLEALLHHGMPAQ